MHSALFGLNGRWFPKNKKTIYIQLRFYWGSRANRAKNYGKRENIAWKDD